MTISLRQDGYVLAIRDNNGKCWKRSEWVESDPWPYYFHIDLLRVGCNIKGNAPYYLLGISFDKLNPEKRGPYDQQRRDLHQQIEIFDISTCYPLIAVILHLQRMSQMNSLACKCSVTSDVLL